MKEGNSQSSEVPRSKTTKKKTKSATRWVIIITLISFFLSLVFNVISETVLISMSGLPAFLILALFILLGIIFDVFGLAAATASEKPFNAMAAKRVTGGKEALWIVKNAEKFSSICNDVVGDICGIMSGSTTAIIVASMTLSGKASFAASLLLTGIVGGLTVGGKALGKGIAIKFNNDIVFFMARVLRVFGLNKK